MSYQVTARKWRPMVFDDVVGQSHVTNTLRNAIATNRVAHAYIFSGTRGCGKTTTARIFARALNCTSTVNQNPDNTCDTCKEIIEGRGLDVIEIDGASNRGVEEIRNLRDSVRYTPTSGSYKIYIIDEVHMLTKEAFNALLKTLEEPPAHVVFIFATTEVHKVPTTILSRCQRFDFRRIAVEEIIASLAAIAKAETVSIDDDSLMIIAKRADGSMRDSQSIFDQVRSFCGNDIHADELRKAFNIVDQELYFRVSELLTQHDSRGAMALVDDVMKSGYDLREFVGGLSEHLRNVLIVRSTTSTTLLETSELFKKRYEIIAQKFSESDLLRFIKRTNELDQELRWAPQPRYRLEAALLQMVTMESSVQIGELLQQFETLKKKLNFSGSIVTAASASGVSAIAQPAVPKPSAPIPKTKTSSAFSYASLLGTDLTKVAGVSNIAEPVSRNSSTADPQVNATSLTVDEISCKWTEFVNDVSKSRIAVGISLREAHVLEVNRGLVRLACPDEYHVSTLRRNKEFLSEIFHQVLGKHATIESVLHAEKKSAAMNTKQPPNPLLPPDAEGRLHSAIPEDTAKDHPVLSLLKRELSAERIE
ncbi:MAG TPA: DNA polymerase III subunit gamma/tau [Bacteroidota bacterium]|nr:DNA polymerase III subunit gamma/tau [Bacteroidota bacterium]